MLEEETKGEDNWPTLNQINRDRVHVCEKQRRREGRNNGRKSKIRICTKSRRHLGVWIDKRGNMINIDIEKTTKKKMFLIILYNTIQYWQPAWKRNLVEDNARVLNGVEAFAEPTKAEVSALNKLQHKILKDIKGILYQRHIWADTHGI